MFFHRLIFLIFIWFYIRSSDMNYNEALFFCKTNSIRKLLILTVMPFLLYGISRQLHSLRVLGIIKIIFRMNRVKWFIDILHLSSSYLTTKKCKLCGPYIWMTYSTVQFEVHSCVFLWSRRWGTLNWHQTTKSNDETHTTAFLYIVFVSK